MATKTPPSEKFLVIRDSREQEGWTFSTSDRCAGTVVRTLTTGDYTLQGFEDQFVIERKGCSGEFAGNLFEARFERELTRLDTFAHAYLLLEFEFEDIIKFPVNSGIPPQRWKQLHITPQLFLKRLHEIQLAHPRLVIWPVGSRGREVASSLFKRVQERHAA